MTLDEILAKHGAEAGEMTHSLKQAILDWHNKQTLELLDRLSVASSYTDKQFSENPQLCLGKKDVQLAIEAERNKLKEGAE